MSGAENSPPVIRGRWTKGVSGNPGGRPKDSYDVIQLARNWTPQAVAALGAALDDPKQRVAAATALLDRAWGKPKQTIETPDGTVLSLTIAHLLGARAASQMLDAQRVIEGDAVATETTTTPPDLMAPAVE